MEGALSAGAACVAAINSAAQSTAYCATECESLARHALKLGLLLGELQLLLPGNEVLRGAGGLQLRQGCWGRWQGAARGAGRPQAWVPAAARAVGAGASGSKSVFMAVDATVGALRQAEQLVVQASREEGARACARSPVNRSAFACALPHLRSPRPIPRPAVRRHQAQQHLAAGGCGGV
jgi:hypothetical protein